jgi:C4-dicarboxylate transporter/malic acid transport protein
MISSNAAAATSGARHRRLETFHPGWYASVMGTAIVGIVAYQNPGQVPGLAAPLQAAGVAMIALAVVLAVVLGVPYVARWVRHREAARRDFANPLLGALYATFPAGLLVLAVGIATVGASAVPGGMTLGVVGVLASVGTLLAMLVSVGFAVMLFRGPGVEPAAVNGTWFIPPVVMTIVPLALAPFAGTAGADGLGLLLAVGYGAWGLGMLLFMLVASLLYARLVFHPLPGAPLAPSLWIALGPIGVGGLVLVRLAQAGTPATGEAAPAISAMSTIGATALWGFGLWWLAVAAVLLVGYRRRGPVPFGIGWWAFTFPLGAYTALTVALARSWQSSAIEAFGVVLFVGLAVAWLIVAAGTVRAVRSGAAWGPATPPVTPSGALPAATT